MRIFWLTHGEVLQGARQGKHWFKVGLLGLEFQWKYPHSAVWLHSHLYLRWFWKGYVLWEKKERPIIPESATGELSAERIHDISRDAERIAAERAQKEPCDPVAPFWISWPRLARGEFRFNHKERARRAGEALEKRVKEREQQ